MRSNIIYLAFQLNASNCVSVSITMYLTVYEDILQSDCYANYTLVTFIIESHVACCSQVCLTLNLTEIFY